MYRLQISQTATSTFFIFIQKRIRLYSNLKNSKAFTSMVKVSTMQLSILHIFTTC